MSTARSRFQFPWGGGRLVAVLLLSLCQSCPSAFAAAARPNVLFLSVDDLKPVLGCYGDTGVKSPNIDRLARRSVRFDHAFCNQAVCAPSRNSLMTGIRPQTLGIYDLGTNFRRGRPDAVTMSQWFMQNGYRAEAMGKILHVGHGNHDDPASWSLPVFKAKVIAYALPASGAPEGLTREEALFDNLPARGLPRGAAVEAADLPDSAYPDGALADHAIARLRAAKEKPDEPFFLAVGFVKPHLPFVAPKKYWDLYDRAAFRLAEVRTPPEGAPAYAPTTFGELRQYREAPESGPIPDDLQRTLLHGYHASISFMDAQLGRVLDELDRLDLAKDTIVVLWGDHGWHLGDHGMWSKHSNYEQAARIPLLVSAPGIVGGRGCGAMVETVDIYPTLAELAGLPRPEGLDGRSFAALVRDPSLPHRDHIIHVFPRGERLGRAIRTERYRLVEWKRIGAGPETAEFELYDYREDPLERRNLAAEQPKVMARMRALLAGHPEAKAQVKGR